MFAMSACWGWWDMGVLILLSFLGMIKPGHILKLRPIDIILPSALMSSEVQAFVRIRSPKMKHVTARREHALIEEQRLVQFLEAWLPTLPRANLIFNGTPASYRRCHDLLVQFFGVGISDGSGITPASHRGGGATWFYRTTRDLQETRWRGRWADMKSLEIYIQEVGALSVLPALTIKERSKIQQFAQAAPVILEAAVVQLRALRA